MHRVTIAPAKYVQGAGVRKEIGILAREMGITHIYALMDRFANDAFGKELERCVADGGCRFSGELFQSECCEKAIRETCARIMSSGADAVLGMGGGKVADAAKAAALFSDIPVIIVPTTASTDAPCSGISVLYTESGKLERYLMLKRNPDLVAVDTELIASAPPRLFAAGMGDAISTYFEARACRKSGGRTNAGGVSTLAANALAEGCFRTILREGEQALGDVRAKLVSEAVENVTEANIYLSGVGFENGGLNWAHAVQDGISMLGMATDKMHGEKVAYGTLVQLALENAPEFAEVRCLLRALGLPCRLADLGIPEGDAERIAETVNPPDRSVSSDRLLAAMTAVENLD